MSTGSGGVSVRPGPSHGLGSRRAETRRRERRYFRRRQGSAPEQPDFACAVLCGSCGRLAWPQPVPGQHPHRREASAPAERTGTCPHCGETHWIDLRRESTALVLRHNEADTLHGRAARARSHRYRLVATTWAALLMGWAGVAIGVGMWSVLGMATATWTIGWLHAAHLRRTNPPPTSLPVRWAMVLPPVGATRATVAGVATASESLLRAPLSGRSCVAYEVGVRSDRSAAAPPHTWMLLEQRLIPLELDGQRVDPEQTHLRWPRHHLGRSTDLTLDEAACIYLRQRGIDPSEALELFETIIEDGVTVCLHQTDAGAVLQPAD